MRQRLLVMLLPDRFFWADHRLTYSAKRLLLRLAAALLCFLLATFAIGLLDRTNWRGVLAGALFAWSFSGVVWALTSYSIGNASTAERVRHTAERDLLHGRLNHLCDRLGAPLLNLNEGDLGGAVAVRVQRHAHMSGLEEFGDHKYETKGGRAFWDNTACGYPSREPPANRQPDSL